MTPLYLAAESGHIKIVTYLCDEGADIKIQDNDGVNLNASRLADWVWISIQLLFEKQLSGFKLQRS